MPKPAKAKSVLAQPITDPSPADLHQPPGQVVLLAVLDIDTSYLKAVGVNPDTAATLIAEKVNELLNHEDFGSTIEGISFLATYGSETEKRQVIFQRHN